MVCLETTFLVDLLRKVPETRELLTSLPVAEPCVVASPSVMELWDGALESSVPERAKQEVDDLLRSLVVLPLDDRAARIAGEIEADLSRRGAVIDVEDMMIAAVAIANGEKVVTRDEHFARIRGLRMETY